MGCNPTWRSSPPPAAATSTVSRSRARSPTSSALQVAALRPSRLFLSHHDDWLPGFSVPTDMAPLRAAVATASPDTELLEPGYLAATDVFA